MGCRIAPATAPIAVLDVGFVQLFVAAALAHATSADLPGSVEPIGSGVGTISVHGNDDKVQDSLAQQAPRGYAPVHRPYAPGPVSSASAWPVSSASAGPYQGSYQAAPSVQDLMQSGLCLIPMWDEENYVCEEHSTRDVAYNWPDVHGVDRQMMKEGATCTLICPKMPWYSLNGKWQSPNAETMACRGGQWRSEKDHEMAGIECRTSAWFAALLVFAAIAWVISMFVGFHRNQAMQKAKRENNEGRKAVAIHGDQDGGVGADDGGGHGYYDSATGEGTAGHDDEHNTYGQ